MSSQLNGTANDHIKLNLDHLYCHPMSDTNNFLNTASNQDIYKILTENKQLKSMLLLHLDLIQEQSDQLILKDKNIAQLTQENESLKDKLERLTQKLRLQQHRQIKTYSKSGSDNSCDNRFFDNQNKISDPEKNVDKQQQKSSLDEQLLLNNNSTSSSTTDSDDDKNELNLIPSSPVSLNENKNLIIGPNLAATGGSAISSIIGVNNGKYINKIILQKIAQPPPLVSIAMQPTINIAASTITTTATSPLTTLIEDDNLPALEPLIKDTSEMFDIKPHNISTVLMVGDDMEQPLNEIETEQENENPKHDITKTPSKSPAHSKKKRKRVLSQTSSIVAQETDKRQYFKPVITTNVPYVTREWKAEEIDEEIKQVKKNLLLETPTWVVKECTGCYTIEGTEDLSDETFAKRHQKFEVDERRRKKWDVQRIREQRTIERLKRHHYKKEIAEENEEKNRKDNIFTSFFPPASSIKFIMVTDEIPVQAFGESVPLLPSASEFLLPWTTLPHPSHINITENSGFELIKTRMQNRRFRKKPPLPPPTVPIIVTDK